MRSNIPGSTKYNCFLVPSSLIPRDKKTHNKMETYTSPQFILQKLWLIVCRGGIEKLWFLEIEGACVED